MKQWIRRILNLILSFREAYEQNQVGDKGQLKKTLNVLKFEQVPSHTFDLQIIINEGTCPMGIIRDFVCFDIKSDEPGQILDPF